MTDAARMPQFEEKLVQRLVNREARAMTAFYQQFDRALHGTVLRVVRNQQSAGNVLQESLLKVSSKQPFNPLI